MVRCGEVCVVVRVCVCACVRLCVCVCVRCRLGYVQSRALSVEIRILFTVASKYLLGIHCISYYGPYIINNAYVSFR